MYIMIVMVRVIEVKFVLKNINADCKCGYKFNVKNVYVVYGYMASEYDKELNTFEN